MPTATRTFRVFVSSTFEDLKAERDALQRDVFPRLRKLCEENNARFQAIDLRWGVRDEAALDQQTMEICLREIERCQHTGIKPNFIVLLGDRYGWRPLPARIEAAEFEAVREHISGAPDRILVEGWYQLDNNAEPPEYLLKPRVAEFKDKDRWSAVEATMHKALREAARAAGLSSEALVKYEASATHQEILKGLGETEEDHRHVFAFFREPTPGDEVDADLKGLKDDLGNKLPAGNIYPFSVADLPKLSADVEEQLSGVIKAETGKFTSRPALDLEIEAHEAFARDRARHFTGRKSVLDAIDAHVRGDESRPLLVHGPSGCGKSAIVAKASARAKVEMPGAVLIQRFIGVSPDSSRGITLLHSLCEQLSREYGVTEQTPMAFQPLVVAFHDRMARATAERPLVLFLDALDQMRSDDEAHSFTWLRQMLPPHVSLIATTTEIPTGLKNAPQVEVEDFPVGEGAEVLAAWLQDARRKLEPAQREKVLEGFARSKLPLHLKLALEEALRWRSFDAAEKCVLRNDVGGMIDVLFDRLSEEANHGPMIVNRSLGFLAAARYGLTEDEMLDILATDDEVWKDFEARAHHSPPARQLPVIVWSRLFLDLEPYLNERVAPGGNVMAFYHRQVAERATAQYLREQEGPARHSALVKYFGKQSHWRNKAAMQANERKITELIQHQVGANALPDLETTLTDIDFVAAKCAAGLLFDLQLDYRDAIAALPEAQEGLRQERTRQEQLARWTKEITEYSRQWSERRQRQARGEVVSEPEPLLPEPPATCRMWGEEEIEAECQRIIENPTRLDRMRAFSGFVQQESYPLVEFGVRAGFVVQHAFNHAPRGPVHDAAAFALARAGASLLTRHWFVRDQYNPRPALLRTLGGHTDSVRSVSVTPDGQRAVSASADKTLRVWDLESGRCLSAVEGHTDSVTSVSVTPNGLRAVSASADKTLRVWELETGRCLRVLDTDAVRSVSVTADGLRAVSASADKTLRVWEFETGRCLRVLEGHTDLVTSVSVTPNGQCAVSASADKTLRVWELETGKCLRVLEGHTDLVMSVSVTPNGQRAVSASHDKTLRVWELETGRCLRVLEGHTDSVRSVSVTADGLRAVSASRDCAFRVWDLESGRCLRVLGAQTPFVDSVSVTADGLRAVSASHDKTLRVWELETGKCLQVLGGHTDLVRSVSVTPDGQRAVSASSDSTLRVWDLESGRCLRVLGAQTPFVDSVSMTPDGERVVSANWDSTLRVWDLESGKCLRVLKGHKSFVKSVEVTPDGLRAVSASSDSTLRVWDLETGRCQRVLEGHTDSVRSVSVTPDGQRAVSASSDSTLRVWDLQTGRCLRVLEGHAPVVDSVSVTAGSLFAVSVSDDHTLRVWDFGTGKCLALAYLPAFAISNALSSRLGQVIAGTDLGHVLQFDLRGLTWNFVVHSQLTNPQHGEARKEWQRLPWWKRIRFPKPKPRAGG